jgi:hypothetical protein
MSKSVALLLFLVFLIASFMISVISAFNAVFPLVRAQTVIATTAYLSMEPNPVGVGQEVNVSMLLEPPPPTPTDRFSGLKVYFTRPDNTTEYVGSLFSNPNGSASICYVPTQVGTYELQLNYSGESFAEGTIVYESATSAITTLNVTAEPQPAPSPSPAPTSNPSPTPSATQAPSSPSTPTPVPSSSTLPGDGETPPPSTPSPTTTQDDPSAQKPTSTPNQQTPAPPPTMLIVASAATMTFVGSGFLIYLKKRKH